MTRAVAEDYSSSSCILLRLLSSASGRDLAPAGGVVCDVAVSPVSLSAVTRCDFFSSVSSLPPCSDSQQGPASSAANAAAAAALPPGSFNDGAPVEPPRRPAHLRRVPAAGLRRGFSERTEGHREGRRRCYVACALIQKKERHHCVSPARAVLERARRTDGYNLRTQPWLAHARASTPKSTRRKESKQKAEPEHTLVSLLQMFRDLSRTDTQTRSRSAVHVSTQARLNAQCVTPEARCLHAGVRAHKRAFIPD